MRRHSYSVVCLFLLLVLLLGTSSSHSLTTTTEAAATAGEVEEGPASPLSSSLLYLRRGRGLQQGPLSSVLLTLDWEVEEQKQERILGTNSHPGRGGGKKSKESEDEEEEEEEEVVEQIVEKQPKEEQGAGTYDETTEGEGSAPANEDNSSSNNESGTAGAAVPKSVQTEDQDEELTTACRAASRGQPLETDNRLTLLYEYELVVDDRKGNSKSDSVLVDGFLISKSVVNYLTEKYLYAYCKQRRGLRFQAGQVRGIHPGTTEVLLLPTDGSEPGKTAGGCFRLQSTVRVHLDDDYDSINNDENTQDMIQDLADVFEGTIIPDAKGDDGDSTIANARFVSGQAGSVNVRPSAFTSDKSSSSSSGRNALRPAGKAFLTLFILGLIFALALVLWRQYRQNHNRNNKDSRSREAVADPEKPTSTGRRREQLEQFRQKTQSKLRDLGQSGKSKIQQGKSKMQDLWDKRRNNGNINKAMTPTATFPTEEEDNGMMVEDTEFDDDNMMVEVSRRRQQQQQEQRGIVVDPDKIVMKAENNSSKAEIEDKIRVNDPIETMSMNGFGTEMVWEGGNDGDDDDGTATHGDGGSTVVTSKGSHSSSNNDEHNVDDGSSSKRSSPRSFLGLRPPRQMKGWTPSRQQLKAAVAETPTTGGTTFFTPETLPSLTEKEKPLLLEIGNRPTNSYTTEMESWSLSHVDIIIDDETETISVDDDDAATSTSFPRSYVIPDTVQL